MEKKKNFLKITTHPTSAKAQSPPTTMTSTTTTYSSIDINTDTRLPSFPIFLFHQAWCELHWQMQALPVCVSEG